MLKKVLVAATLAGAIVGLGAPAMAAGQVCLTTDVNVNGTPAPTNGTNCVDTP